MFNRTPLRILISSGGLLDVLQHEKLASVPHIHKHFQVTADAFACVLTQTKAEDLMMLGRLILGLACGSMAAASREAYGQSMKHVGTHYSEDLFNVIRSKPAREASLICVPGTCWDLCRLAAT